MVFVRALLPAVYCLRKISAAFVYGAGLLCGNDDGQAVSMDIVSVLFCGIHETGGRRNSARRKCNAAIYDSDIYGFDSACRPSICIFSRDGFRNGYLVCVAGRLDHRDGLLRCLLPQGVPEIIGINFIRRLGSPAPPDWKTSLTKYA